ncbi:MAG: alpha/beta hydrolase-fold protein [Deferrisomatales bacterium]|nr:alpha/beta hydrolase-fold protein [Deferrisomatales bacterium]
MRSVRRLCIVLLGSGSLFATACGQQGSNGDGEPTHFAARDFRAVAGISMGAYGAMNLGTKRPDLFGTIGSLGGPVDMQELLAQLIGENLEVKPQAGVPGQEGDDFTFDHMKPYPSRNTRIRMIQDLVLAFGNPFLHHPDPSRRYLASDSEPAAVGRDDRYGSFSPLVDPRGFLDGGDANADGLRQVGEVPDRPTDVLLLAPGSLASVFGLAGTMVGGRELVDLDADGIYDVGDGIVVNYSEPFVDLNGNFVFEPELGETFEDLGLDGVAGTGDFGEGNGVFDYDPDRSAWLAEDPLSRLAARPAAEIASQRIYMDVGTGDEFGFARHYDNVVAMLDRKGLSPVVRNGFSGNCFAVPRPSEPFLLIRYDGGHVGIPGDDAIRDDLLSGDFCGAVPIWQRLLTLIGYLDRSFPDGFFGAGGLHLTGDVITRAIPSPALATGGQPAPGREVVVYRPPAFANTNRSFPVVYFLGGYGQDPEDYRRMGNFLDVLIGAGAVQNMCFAFLPGSGGHRGSFFVNHRVPESQVPGLATVTSGRYEDSILQDLIPEIENGILDGRVRAQ